MAVQIPHRINPEISASNALRAHTRTTRGDIPRVGAAQGVLDRGRAHHGGPCAHAFECAAEDRGVERGRLHQRKERDSYRPAFYEAREELRRAGVLGTRVFCGYGGTGYRNDQAVYSRPRKRGPKARPTGDALD